EPVDLLRLAAQMIVEAQHLGDEPWSKLERQLLAGSGGACGRLRHDVAFDPGEPSRRAGEARVQEIVELVAGNNRLSRGDVAERARENSRSAARRDDDNGFAEVRGTPNRTLNPEPRTPNLCREARDRRAKCLQVRDANELRPARCDHLSCGSRIAD